MLEFTGLGGVLRTLGVLYWVLAGGAVVYVLSRENDRRDKIFWTAVVVAIFGFLPGILAVEKYRHDAYAREAWAYFKKKCETEAGEKIYKTFTGVKSVLVIKPLPPATDADHFDQFWYGDPYSASATSLRVDNAAGTLVYPDAPISMQKSGRGFDFVESYVSEDKSTERKLVKYFYQPTVRDYRTEPIAQSVSRFGLAWEDISTAEDRKFWVAGSRLRIIDLRDNDLIAERIGYFIEAGLGSRAAGRRPWLTSRGPNTTCPPLESSDYADRWFILKVLKPADGAEHGN